MPASLPLAGEISQASQATVEFKLNEVTYGNGYSQRSPLGLNSSRQKWEVIWENLTATEFNTVVGAIEGSKGADYFTWTAPGDSSSKKWVVRTYTKQVSAGNAYTVSATIEQVFDI